MNEKEAREAIEQGGWTVKEILEGDANKLARKGVDIRLIDYVLRKHRDKMSRERSIAYRMEYYTQGLYRIYEDYGKLKEIKKEIKQIRRIQKQLVKQSKEEIKDYIDQKVEKEVNKQTKIVRRLDRRVERVRDKLRFLNNDKKEGSKSNKDND